METADKDDEPGCMRALERPPSSKCMCAHVCIINRELHITGTTVPLSSVCSSQWTYVFVDTGLGLCQGTQYGGNIQQCCISGALQDSRSHLSALFSWWDIFKGHHGYETGPSLTFMVSGGRCILLIPLTPFSVCHQAIKHVTMMFGDKSQNGDKAVHYCDGRVIIRTYPICFSHGGFDIHWARSLKISVTWTCHCWIISN